MEFCSFCSLPLVCPVCEPKPGHPRPDLCPTCSRPITKGAAHCRKCHGHYVVKPFAPNPKITWPDRDQLEQMVVVLGFRQTGQVLGVSDNAVRKHYLKHP
jgi:hypothetical protein